MKIEYEVSEATVARLDRIEALGLDPSSVLDDLVEAFCVHAGLEEATDSPGGPEEDSPWS